MRDERALAFLRELERADEAAAVDLAALDELAAAVEEIRRAGLETEARLARLPAEREAAAVAREAAAAEAAERGRAHELAAAELAVAETGRDAGRLAAARRTEVRARDAARMAARRAEAAAEEEARLEREAEELERRAQQLEAKARAAAAAIRERPALGERAGAAPVPGLAAVARWATDARAALFVARGQLAARREALIRQANELGSVVLGEPLAASSAAGVARRVEREAGPSP